MVGYPEALTDPSYRGQILVLTFPLVGNYGVPSMDTKDKWDLPLYFESDDVQIAGLVVSNYSADPSHWASQQSLGNWLAKAGVPAIFGVDTRALTKGLRERGSILGRLEVEGAPPSPPQEVGFVDPNLRNLVAEVSTKTIRTYNQGGDKPTIVAIDCGAESASSVILNVVDGVFMSLCVSRGSRGGFATASMPRRYEAQHRALLRRDS